MSDDIALKLSSADSSYLIAPAGYGKTEIIARAVSMNTEGKDLLLTHTHAGVRSMRERLRRLGVPTKNYIVKTIASWSLTLASSFPTLSGIETSQPVGDEWKNVYKEASNALINENIQNMLAKSYSGVYIDEYQDCIKSQHNLVMRLKQVLPVRILGDPLQGIFGFADDPLIEWRTDVFPQFDELEQLKIPWRWKEKNPSFGSWIDSVRISLLNGDPFDIRNAPKESVTWIQYNDNSVRKVCFDAAKHEGSVLVIQKWPNQAHKLASQLSGIYTSMEEIECRDLLQWSRSLDQADNITQCLTIIDGAGKCWTGLKSELKSIYKAIEEGRKPRSKKYPEINEIFEDIIHNPNVIGNLLQALKLCSKAGKYLYRKELWQEMCRVIETYQYGNHSSFEDGAWHIRNQARRRGIKLDNRIVSRNLLIKGLEFDHVIIANADIFSDPKNLYVALSRSKKTLTVLSRSPIIRRNPPEF